MKKITSLLLVAFMAMTTYNVAYAAFPVKTEKSQKAGKSVEKLSIEKVKVSDETKEEAATAAGGGGKSQVVAAILAFFLGALGIHNFYLGNTSKGLMQLGGFLLGLILMIVGVVAFATSGSTSIPILALIGYFIILGVSIWAFIDFIRILIGNYPGL